MNKTLLAVILSLSVQGSITAQSKISANGQIFLDNYRNGRQSTLSTSADIPQNITVIAMLADGYNATDIEAAGYNVTTDFGETVLVCLAIDEIEQLAALDAVRSIDFGGTRKPKMDFARTDGGVATAHNGLETDGESRSFTGKGVVAGFFDTGLEGNHVNFLNDNGSSRIQKLWHYKNPYVASPTPYSASSVRSFTTDDEAETHATHVAGIMAGSYKDNGTYAYTSSGSANSSTKRQNSPIPYYGVAYESDIACGVGYLTDPIILDGVKRIVEYAESQQKPCVVNLSLGGNLGPHDGTDSFTSTLNSLGSRAIICISSGNEGDMNMSLVKTFTADDLSVKTFLQPMTSITKKIDSGFEVWSEDESALTVTISTYRKSTGAVTQVVTNNAATRNFNAKTGMSSGAGTLISGIDPNNGRYYVRMSLSAEIAMTDGYYFMIAVAGTAGKKAVMYYGGYGEFTSNNVKGFTSGNADESINGNATAPNLISVGAYSTRQSFGVLGDSFTYVMANCPVGTIADFSSYGTMPDGTSLPTVLAPGASIISSYSSYYVNMANEADYTTGSAVRGAKTYYWGALDGTSMSSPFAAGVIALWLEADPTLNIDDIKEIISATSVTDRFTQSAPHASGAGKIDAAEGLRYILLRNAASIGTVTDSTTPRILVTIGSDHADVTTDSASDFTARIIDLQGRCVASVQGSSGEARISTIGLQHGIYLLNVHGQGIDYRQKIAIN